MLWGYLLLVGSLYASVCCAAAFNVKVGPYDILLRHFEECPDVGSGDIRLIGKLKRLNRTTLAVDFNMTLKVPYDDTVSIVASFAQQTNGGFKENFHTQTFTKSCSIWEQIAPKLYKELLIAMNVQRCPLPKGYYSIKNFTTKERLTQLPVFFYNKYKTTVSYNRNGKLLGCLSIYVDVVPKKKVLSFL